MRRTPPPRPRPASRTKRPLDVHTPLVLGQRELFLILLRIEGMVTSLSAESFEQRIYLIRGERVMLDTDLAAFYGVTNLNKAVKRNRRRFPADFMFQLTPSESRALTFQIGMSNGGRGGLRRDSGAIEPARTST